MSDIRTQALACRDAATAIAALDNGARRLLLLDMAQAIDSHADAILAANEKDMAQAAAKGVQGAMLDRLRLDAARVATIANAVREVAELPDPVGQVTRRDQLPNGLAIERVRIPLGVITMIYEARPNVTADAAALCLKAGNAVILRGGSEALHSNTASPRRCMRRWRSTVFPRRRSPSWRICAARRWSSCCNWPTSSTWPSRVAAKA